MSNASNTITADPLKIVNILLPATDINDKENDNSDTSSGDSEDRSTSVNVSSGYVPPRLVLKEDDLYAEPTFSEKFFRYLVIVIYLGGLSSLGFFLSMYYIFFWDSRMPPVYKPTKKPPVFIKP
ncbi:uncharacterized protein LOC111680009 [Lucilia cuprina]|uniref:uncharacterized protein LOC111680009 n=1 Tax=Lucilia cuprina TaxID=7375 RepID=UPI001F055EAE|nr:uncharacterized protein LOC111680009 [Lucilia cuprina]